ncbi:MAG: prepilin-type N-terminal cleavage/methylation domain-containing protein [Methylococcales bacterium]|nr:prepilin-type N-terminal cleavage/methylation domain-containing protein [Methylococcales bacterium]
MRVKQKAFTLIEILIGMSLLSVMMLLLFASLRTCVKNWNAGEKKIAQVSEAAIVQGFFQTKLYTALPLQADFFEEEKFSFQGEKEKIQFVSSMPSSAGRLGLQLFLIRLQKEENGDNFEIIVNISPFFPRNEEAEWEEESITILKNVKKLQFSYFGQDGFIDEPDWLDEWVDQSALPKMVGIDITLGNGNVWPKIVVPLTIEAMKTNNSNSRINNKTNRRKNFKNSDKNE